MLSFIKCLLDKDYKQLGKGTIEKQLECWQTIYDEYATLIKDDSTEYIFELQRDIYVLNEKVQLVEFAVELLKNKYDATIVAQLNLLGIFVRLDWSNKKEYREKLNICLSKSKTWVVEISRKQKEMDKFLSDNKGEGYSWKFFYKVNGYISKFMGFKVDLKNTMVLEWCNWLNDMQQYNEENRKVINQPMKGYN